CLQGISTPYMF
nr:immunoglobulin light chain junction region [Macaca mulatta]